MEDFQALEDDIRKIPEEFKQLLEIFKELRPKYDNIPSAIDDLETFNKRKAEQFEEDAEFCSKMIGKLLDELDVFKENLLDMAEDVEELSEDFEDEKEFLEQAVKETEEDFNFSRDHAAERDQ